MRIEVPELNVSFSKAGILISEMQYTALGHLSGEVERGGGGLITFTAPCTITVFLPPYDVNSTFSISSRKRPTRLLSGLP